MYCCLSLVCLIIGASSTHGLGGYLQWGRRRPPHARGRRRLSPAPTHRLNHPHGGVTAAAAGLRRRVAAGLPARGGSPAGGTVLPDEQDLGVSQGRGLLLAGRVGSFGQLSAASSGSGGGGGDAGAPAAAERAPATAAAVAFWEQDVEEDDDGAEERRGGAEESPWAFFQPFAGGTVFVATQVRT